MDTIAVVLERPRHLVLSRLDLSPPGAEDVVVAVEWSGISTGTERLLWSGDMPAFPGMGYPLVPGYESVGRIVDAGDRSGAAVGDRVFVPGSRCFGDVRSLFGGTAARLVAPGARVLAVDDDLDEKAVLLALAATAYHAIAATDAATDAAIDAGADGRADGGAGPASSHKPRPELIVGHGVLGRLLARLTCVLGGPAPVVWERDADRAEGAAGYAVVDPADDARRDYRAIYDASGDSAILDSLMARLGRGGEIVLAGFYAAPLSFAFPPAFMREARIRVAAEWQRDDLVAVKTLVESGRLSLDGLITHRRDATEAPAAYRTAFGDPGCLKMILDWRAVA